MFEETALHLRVQCLEASLEVPCPSMLWQLSFACFS